MIFLFEYYRQGEKVLQIDLTNSIIVIRLYYSSDLSCFF